MQRSHHVGVDGLIGNLLSNLIAQLLGGGRAISLSCFSLMTAFEFLFLSAGGGQGLFHLRLGFRGGDRLGRAVSTRFKAVVAIVLAA